MIYYVSKQLNFNFPKDIQNISIEKSLQILNKSDWLGCDTETTGLDSYIDNILLLSFGTSNYQVIIDTTTIDIHNYDTIFKTKHLIFQNAKFDLKLLFHKNIVPLKQLWDTMLAEQVLYSGLEPIINLAYLSDKYTGITLNKEERINIVKRGITVDSIYYAANDVKVLQPIRFKQYKKAKEKNVLRAIKLENNFVLPLAYIEYNGMPINKQLWLEKTNKLKPIITKLEIELEQLLINDDRFQKFKNLQTSLFYNEKLTTINFDSPTQIKEILKLFKLNLKDKDSKSGESTGNKILSKYKENNEFVSKYLEYKKFVKDFTTYGEKFLDSVHPITGRIHSNYNQMVSTGRISSNSPNLNNIPSDPITRACFETTTNSVLIDADFSDQEGKLLADVSGDSNLLNFYLKNGGDGHCYTARLCFPDKLANLSDKEIKIQYTNLRNLAKGAKFALSYGGNGSTIAKNVNISIKEGKEVETAFFKAFSGLKLYFDKVKTKTSIDGFITISPLTQRKFFYPNFFSLKEDSYEYYDFVKKSLNYPIQGVAAEMIKLASIYMFWWIVNNGLFKIVLIIGNIYDELIIESPLDTSEKVSKVLQILMEKAANKFTKYLKITAKPLISKHWLH